MKLIANWSGPGFMINLSKEDMVELISGRFQVSQYPVWGFACYLVESMLHGVRGNQDIIRSNPGFITCIKDIPLSSCNPGFTMSLVAIWS